MSHWDEFSEFKIGFERLRGLGSTFKIYRSQTLAPFLRLSLISTTMNEQQIFEAINTIFKVFGSTDRKIHSGTIFETFPDLNHHAFHD